MTQDPSERTPQKQPARPARRESQTSQRRRSGHLTSVQLMFAAILAIGLTLAVNFSTRIANSRLQREVFQSVSSEVEALKEDRATLQAELDFVQSDAYVEQWARSDGKMVRPGEVIVVPLPLESAIEPTPAPTPVVRVETSPPEPDPWTLWWSLFFDTAPPGR